MKLNNEIQIICRQQKNYGCLLLIHLLFFMQAFTQQPALSFKHITSTNGLSQNHVYCILQDYKGFMWFGTQDGLNKYDGYKVTVYKNNSKDTHSISGNYIRAIYEDNNKNLWIGTISGLNLYDRKNDRFIQFKHNAANNKSLSHNEVTAICEDHDGNLWIGTLDGLNLLDKKANSFTRYKYEKKKVNSPSDNFISIIYEDKRGNLWIGTSAEGLNLFDKVSKTFKSYQPDKNNPKSISGVFVSAIEEDRNENLWIATTNGLNLFNRDKETFTHYLHDSKNKNSLAHNVIYSMYEDSKGNLWIGTMNSGLNLFNPEKNSFTHYVHDPTNENSISNNTPSAIYEDRSNTLWVGVHRGGVNYHHPLQQKFTTYRHQPSHNSISNNNIRAFAETMPGHIWIGTEGGGLNLFLRKKDSFIHYRHAPANPASISSNVVLSLCADDEDNVWVGTFEGGLNKYENKHNRFIRFSPASTDTHRVSVNSIWYILEDKNNNLWIGDFHYGFYLFNTKTNQFHKHTYQQPGKVNLNPDDIRVMYKDSYENVWIGTFRGGLNRFNPKTNAITRYLHNENDAGSISSNEILSIYEDEKKRLWIGTRNGLNLFDSKTGLFKIYNQDDGLPNNVIQSILEDSKGHLWMGTLAGLSRFNPGRGEFKNYNELDGLQGNEFSRNACLKTKDGQLFFGGIHGFNAFYPDSIKQNNYIPPVYITNFQIFNKPVSIGNGSPLTTHINEAQTISLSYKHSVISFEFAALNYIVPEKNQYAYKLEGFDEEWNFVGNQRSATYTNLDAGQYTFRVKASNNDGIWNEQGTFISITIVPPFWETWWFRLLAVLFVLACFIGFYRARIGMIKKQKKVLEDQVEKRTRTEEALRQLSGHLQQIREEERISIAREIHDELGQQLTSIKMDVAWVSKKVEADEKGVKQKLSGIVSLLDEMIKSVRRISAQLRPSILDDLGLIAAMEWHSQEFEKRSGIHTSFCAEMHELSVVPNVATGLFRIYQESLTNVARHADARRVSSSLQIQNTDLVLKISDNGKGFEINKTAGKKTLGLLGMRERTMMMGGKYEITSTLGKGTTVLVTVPLRIAQAEQSKNV